MLSKFFLRAAVTAAALTCTTGSASAEQFQILVMEHAFFPEISYVQPGDEVTFLNMSGVTRVIQARNNAWNTPPLSEGDQATIVIEQGMKNSYLSRIQGSGNGSGDGGSGDNVNNDAISSDLSDTEGLEEEEGTIMGTLNFSSAPTSATNDG